MKTTTEKKIAPTAEADKNEAMAREVTDMGEVRIHENVISALVREAALNVDGVVRLAGSSLVNNIAEIVGSRRMQDRSITVNFEEDNRVSLEIKLILEFGSCIPDVTGAIQRKVIEAVEHHTGMTVKRVDIVVQALENKEEKDEAEAESQPVEPVR